jgi:catechol 2,3-dioxygenase-like lactoylglutathione lyase family enzyme
VRLAHLSLAVADQQRSRRFYETFFGLHSDGSLDAEGCLHLTDANGFDLTLVARSDSAPSPTFHFGIGVADPSEVSWLLARLSVDGVQTGELYESDDRVAFHCWDPDGYQVEVFWAK